MRIGREGTWKVKGDVKADVCHRLRSDNISLFLTHAPGRGIGQHFRAAPREGKLHFAMRE